MRFAVIFALAFSAFVAKADDHGPVMGLPVPPTHPPVVGLPIPPRPPRIGLPAPVKHVPLPMRCTSPEDKQVRFDDERGEKIAFFGDLEIPCESKWDRARNESLVCEYADDNQVVRITLKKGANGKYNAVSSENFIPHFPPGAMGMPARPIVTKYPNCRTRLIMGMPVPR